MIELTLKEEFKVNFIPYLQRLISQEKTHYEWLDKHDEKLYPMVSVFKAKSEAFMSHLTQRLEEYIQYADRLP